MGLSLTRQPAVRSGSATAGVVAGPISNARRNPNVDLHPDGERVALAPAAESPNGGKQDHAVFVFNFFDELQRLAPSKR